VIAPEGDGRWIEYAGGYSDMLAQRGADLAREERKTEPAKAEKAATAEPTPAAAAKRRMSYKDKHALETLPATIAGMQQEAAALQARLNDPNFYVRDRSAFEKTTSALGDLQQKIAAAEEQWLTLEIMNEELSAAPTS
jgi:ATP-binding cassette subfamily F protein uup